MGEKKSKKKLSFEEAMEQLERIVQELEAGDVPLEQLIARYKEGLFYQKYCQKQLERSALLIEQLKPDGTLDSLLSQNH